MFSERERERREREKRVFLCKTERRGRESIGLAPEVGHGVNASLRVAFRGGVEGKNKRENQTGLLIEGKG